MHIKKKEKGKSQSNLFRMRVLSNNMLGFGATMKKYLSSSSTKKGKPKMKGIELRTPPEQTQTITRSIFDVVKEHGPLTIQQTWERVQEVGLRGLTSKRQMKIVMRWMRERQKLRLVCNHVGPHKQFLYTTWFSKPNFFTSNSKQHPPAPPPSLSSRLSEATKDV